LLRGEQTFEDGADCVLLLVLVLVLLVVLVVVWHVFEALALFRKDNLSVLVLLGKGISPRLVLYTCFVALNDGCTGHLSRPRRFFLCVLRIQLDYSL